MISKAQVSHITALHSRKGRETRREFLAEGSKLVTELLNSRIPVTALYATTEWLGEHPELKGNPGIRIETLTEAEMARITALAHPGPVLAVAPIPASEDSPLLLRTGLTLALDDIADPGNLGTIIRIADWFGIPQVVCSPGTVDLYNPKVIQSTMGSFLRVKVVKRDLATFLGENEPSVPVFGTFPEGENLYARNLPAAGVILIGNEARGISPNLEKYVTRRLSIPSFALSGEKADHAESLNAAVAAAIVCAEFRRQSHE
jgi:RNA methyltransferase, TrmH family